MGDKDLDTLLRLMGRVVSFAGMLIMGGILGNVPGIDVGRAIDPDWSSTAR